MVTQLVKGERKMSKKVFIVSVLFGAALLLAACGKKAEPTEPTTTAPAAADVAADAVEIVRAGDDLPAPLNRAGGKTVRVDLETKELNGFINADTTFNYWTYGGKVPGPFLRVTVGDTIELHLKNDASSKFPHSIDIHAVTGPGGGGGVSGTNPGQESVATFKALNPGLFVYHCATPDIPTHIARGMYGLILVEPKGGLPKVDKEFYVMQGDWNLKGGDTGHQEFDVTAMDNESPKFVTFNGKVLGLTGDLVMKAKVGDKIRIFVGNGGPNLVSSFHVIGEIFDVLHPEGSTDAEHNVQTTLIPSGGAAWVEFKAEVPATLLLVDHSIGRLHKGAAGAIVVEGADQPAIYKSVQSGSSAPAAE